MQNSQAANLWDVDYVDSKQAFAAGFHKAIEEQLSMVRMVFELKGIFQGSEHHCILKAQLLA